MIEKVPYQFEPNESLIGEYLIRPGPHQGSLGESGVLAVTSKRILFYRKHSILKKLFKREEPLYELFYSINLTQVLKVSYGGTFDKYININGKRYYVVDVNNKMICKVIKSAIKNLKSNKSQPTGSFEVSDDDIEEEKEEEIPSENQNIYANSTIQRRFFCQYCGKENSADAHFCNGCGSKLN